MDKATSAADLIIVNKSLANQNKKAKKRLKAVIAANKALTKVAGENCSDLKRLYTFLSQIGRAIAHVGDQQLFLKEVCRIAVETGEFRASWIGFLDANRQQVNLVESYGGLPADFAQVTLGKVLSGDTYSICSPTKDETQISCIVLPLKRSGTVMGTLTVYTAGTGFFSLQEINLLVEATTDISFALDIFERQRQKLKADELAVHKDFRLNQAQSIARFGSWELDLSTGIVLWSDEMLRIYGVPATQRQQTLASWSSFLHPEDYQYVMAVTKDAAEARENVTFSHRIVRRDGSIRQIQSQSHMEFDHEGNPTGLVGIAHDITEITEAVAALRTSESNLNAVIENTDAFIYSLDREFRYITFNNKLYQMMLKRYGIQITPGYDVFSVIGEFTPADITEWLDVYTRALNGEIVRFEKDLTTDCVKSPHSFSIHPIWENEMITGVSCFVTDISVQKLAEQEMLKIYKDKDIILESIGDAFFAVDSNWVVTYWNTQAEKLLGKSRANTFGRGLWLLFPDAVKSSSFKNYHLAMTTNQPVHFEDYYPPLAKWYEVSAYPSDNGLSVYFKDITARKQTEVKLVESEKRYSDLFELSPLSKFVFDLNTLLFLDVNKAAINLYGFKRTEFLKMSVRQLRPPGDVQLSGKLLTELRSGSASTRQHALTHQKKNGEIIKVDIQSSPVIYKGKNARIVAVIDITESLSYIHAIEAQNKKLKEISWQQSHVVRAPLARIMGLIPLITNTEGVSTETKEMMSYLMRSAYDLDRVIHTIIRNTDPKE